jgi:hypothetical protein
MAVPSNADPALHNLLSGSSGHEVKVVDLVLASSFPTGLALWCLGLAAAVATLVYLIRRRGAVDEEERHEYHSDIGYGAPCPNCRSYATRESGDVDSRTCELCGHSFSLRD